MLTRLGLEPLGEEGTPAEHCVPSGAVTHTVDQPATPGSSQVLLLQQTMRKGQHTALQVFTSSLMTLDSTIATAAAGYPHAKANGIQGYTMSGTVASVHSAFLTCGSHIIASQRKGTTGILICDLPTGGTYGLLVETAVTYRETGSSHKDFWGGGDLLLWRKKPRVSGQFYSDGNLVGARQAPLSLPS